MEQQTSVVEHWTVTRRGLVLSGPRGEIETIASALRLPDDAPVDVTASTATLALWGESLETYTRAFSQHGDDLTAEAPAPVPTPDD
jgi:hypothetical protein